MKRLLSFVLASLFFFPIFAQEEDKVVERIIELGKSDNQTMHHSDVLSNVIGGRFIGSFSLSNAEKWAAREFESWGLEVIVDTVGVLNVGFDRGPFSGRLLSEDGEILHFATPTFTVGTKGVQRGEAVIMPKDSMTFERMKGVIDGAWVLWDSLSPGFAVSQSEPLMKRVIEAGALGIIQPANVPIRALYDKEYRKYSFDSLPAVPNILLAKDQFDKIYKKASQREYFQLEFDIRNHFRMGPAPYCNVLGVMRGTEYPDEYVFLSCHLDSYDIASGGVDCGAGVCVTMEAARLLALSGAKPKRTIIFALWTGEEAGLLGSKHWVENNPDKLDKISNFFNRDYAPTVPTYIAVNEAMYEDFCKVCEGIGEINEEFPFQVIKNTRPPRPRPTTAGGSDHAYFAMNGVPTIGLGITDHKGYNFNYGEIWHTERDSYNKVYPDYQEHASIVSAIVAYRLANLDHLLSREGLYAEPKAEEPKVEKTKGRRSRK